MPGGLGHLVERAGHERGDDAGAGLRGVTPPEVLALCVLVLWLVVLGWGFGVGVAPSN